MIPFWVFLLIQSQSSQPFKVLLVFGILQMEVSSRIPIQKELARIRPLVSLAASTAQKIRDRCAYGWVEMNDLIVAI